MPSKIDSYNARRMEPRFEKQSKAHKRWWDAEEQRFETAAERAQRKKALRAEREAKRDEERRIKEENRMVQEELAALPSYGMF